MFARFARLPVRRSLHTSAPKPKTPFLLKRSTRTVFVASALATAFVGYQLSRQANELALDALPSHVAGAPAHSAPKTSRPAASSSTPTSSSGSSDAFLPDQPPPPDNAAPVPEPETLVPAAAPPSSGEGEVPPSPSPSSGEVESPPPSEDASDPDTPKPAPSGAYNPETGEINWDCPCLGGMAHGPCGPEFKEAFSCFIFSEAEPKGINCVDKFQNMQNCFRAHPEVYADEIMEDDEDEAPAAGAEAGAPVDGAKAPSEPLNGDKLPDTPPPVDTDAVQKPHVEGSNPAAGSS